MPFMLHSSKTFENLSRTRAKIAAQTQDTTLQKLTILTVEGSLLGLHKTAGSIPPHHTAFPHHNALEARWDGLHFRDGNPFCLQFTSIRFR